MTADYGLDAPGLMRGFCIAGLGLLGLGAVLSNAGTAPWVGIVVAAIALYPLGMACLMVVYSRIIKLADRDQMLDRVDWSTIRAVVDLGCGRGLLTIGAARRMTDGKAIGVDIWSAVDQSGNTAEAAQQNAQVEGVASRAQFLTADMRALPQSDASVDLVVSAWAIHNLATAQDRKQALTEAVRVLAPDGQIMISDIACMAEYQTVLSGLGLQVERRDFGPIRAWLLPALSFGSFGPAMLVARRA